MKKCAWCGESFPIKHKNHRYCSQRCQKEAHLEQKRDYQRKQYKKDPKSEMLRTLGTSTFRSSRSNSTNKEIREIKNEQRFLKLSSTRYRRRDTYFKKIKFTTNFKILKGTHNFASKNDYSKNSTSLTTNQDIKSCYECNSTNILKDYERAEIFCGDCGLVHLGPPQYGIIYPYKEQSTIFTINNNTTTAKSMDWQEWYGNDDWEKDLVISILENSDNDNKKVDVICAKCYSPHTIPLALKEDFKCAICSSTHCFGVGLCRPREYIKDEFTEGK